MPVGLANSFPCAVYLQFFNLKKFFNLKNCESPRLPVQFPKSKAAGGSTATTQPDRLSLP
jgi:hypothetical protein